MALFKDVKKPVIRTPRQAADISPLRPTFVRKRPPCSSRCGAGADVRAFVTALAQAEAVGHSPETACDAAWRILADAHPFPATLGRICPHSCEQACHRRSKDGAVGINAIERWLGDVALARGFALPVLPRSGRVGRIAVAGAGPTGLSCAYQLARRGHEVTMFEARDLPGGRLRDATRTGRLAAAIVDAEIARVLRLGIGIRCATTIGSDLAALAAAHDFVFVATGRGSQQGISDEQANCGLRTTDYGFVGGDAVRPGLVSSALADGRLAADAIDAAINRRTLEPATAMADVPAERVMPGWYPESPRRPWTTTPNAADAAIADADVVAEAKRCMSCGLCMDCERCWMYCTNNCFEKPAKTPGAGRRPADYRLNVDACNGCRKCADECPCGYIDMV